MRFAIFCCGLCALSATAQDQFDTFENDSIRKLDEVVVKADVVLGSKFKAKNRAGSSYFVSQEELKTFNYGDINRVLRTIPGVNVVEEEGFGHRPSIGLRGTSPSRSSKITLMEDGVLIAPAPYSAPAAYYFPTLQRIQSVEILKGGSQIQYGPFTTGGAINLVSTQIPTEFSGAVQAQIGQFNTRNTYVNIGDNYKNFGYLLEYNNRNSDGFKRIDYSNKNTGFQGNDYVAKFRFNTNTDAAVFQSLTVKLQKSDESANETYLGLTDDDFRANPNRRYLSSENDHIGITHEQIMLTHILIPSDQITVTTKAYRNDFSRNWYKLHDVRFGGETFALADILNRPNDFQQAYDILTGAEDSPANALRYRNNNRKYRSEGLQTVVNWRFETASLKHDIDAGIRYHRDYEDRFQWNDLYTITNRQLFLTSRGIPGSQDNRMGNAEAWASHILYNLHYEKWTFTPGLRYENILRRNINFGTADIEREGTNINRAQNRTDVFIPGMGILYQDSEHLGVFASVHRGFSPAGANDGQKPEKSINSELGLRWEKSAWQGEIIGFHNRFSNLLGADTAAAGGTGMGDLFNAGKAQVQGLEVLTTYNLLNGMSTSYKLPITLSYTYTDTELKSNFNSGVEAWGNISRGDEIPYIARHQWALVAGVEHEKWGANLSGKYNGRFRTLAGQGAIPANELVESFFVLDATVRYHFTEKTTFFANALNVLDEKYAVARVPAGLRPGMPFAVNLGVIARF